jgi:hypothetical protein
MGGNWQNIVSRGKGKPEGGGGILQEKEGEGPTAFSVRYNTLVIIVYDHTLTYIIISTTTYCENYINEQQNVGKSPL